VADLVADANAARPVTAGGSGATSAVGANDAFNTAGADIASAATVNLANATGVVVNITGTVTITAFGTLAAGIERVLVFAGALTLTHNATSLILPGAANIVTAAGDIATMRSLGGGNWRCVGYQRANGQQIASALAAASLTVTTTTGQAIGVNGTPAAGTPGLQVNALAGAGNAAFASFNRNGTFAGNFGIDTDNFWKVGGWSMGANAYKLLHEGLSAGTFTGAYTFSGTVNVTGALQKNGVALPFTKGFESAQQTWTNGGTLTLAHGLGVQPKLYHAYAVCILADGGYSAGDEILLAAWASDAADGRGVSLRPDATNISVFMGVNGLVMVSTSGGYNYKSNPASTWKLIIRAWA
jgi:hypothetical protein